MATMLDPQLRSPALSSFQLNEDEMLCLRRTLRIIHQLRERAELVQADDLRFALYRAGELLAMLTRHRGEIRLN